MCEADRHQFRDEFRCFLWRPVTPFCLQDLGDLAERPFAIQHLRDVIFFLAELEEFINGRMVGDCRYLAADLTLRENDLWVDRDASWRRIAAMLILIGKLVQCLSSGQVSLRC